MRLLQLRHRRVWIGALWLLVLAIVLASLVPGPELPSDPGLDKIGHCGAYFLLALLGSGLVLRAGLPRVMLRTFLLGLALEVAQAYLTETRTADWFDVAANGAGVLIAWWIAHRGPEGWARDVEAWLARRAGPNG